MADTIKCTERYGYGYIDQRAFMATVAPVDRFNPAIGVVPRTIVGITVGGRFYPKYPPIEQDWDHLAELLRG